MLKYTNINSKIPNDFNYYEYINNYSDLQFFSKQQATIHYINHGKLELRDYNTNKLSDFDPFIYKYLNKDLINLSDEDAILHYIRYGKYDNRQ